MAIGFGNYISLPIMLAAKSLHKKTVIHEQNSFVGKANRYLDTKMDLVIGSYKEDLKQFKNKNTLILGNPQSFKAVQVKRDEKLLSLMGLDDNKKTVVIFMGSLGSETVTKIMLDYFKLKDDSYQVIYATGKKYYKMVRDNCKDSSSLKIFERIDGIKVMKSCDLLVSRAGATTLCEVCALGMPSILIPSPFVPNNHQYYNALSLTENDAAIMLEEKDLNAKSLNKMIKDVIFDEDRLNDLSRNALKLSNNSVIEDIINEIEKL